MANTMTLRTYDDGELIEALQDQAHLLKMSFQEYCLMVLRASLYPDDELITALRDRMLELESRKTYRKGGLLPGERRVL